MKQRMHLTRTVNLQIRKINGGDPALYTQKECPDTLVEARLSQKARNGSNHWMPGVAGPQ